MTRAAHTPAEPTQPDPSQDLPPLFVPGRLAAVLHVVRVLLGFGRRFAETAPARARHPHFATAAAAFGTSKLEIILARVQRGILRAIALERYLMARAARGRDLSIVKRRMFGQPVGFTDPPASNDAPTDDAPAVPQQTEPPPAKRKRRRPLPDFRSALDPDHPAAFCVYTMEELDAQVRSWPIGRTIAEICNDFAVLPAFCDGKFWNDIYNVLWYYGGSFTFMFERRKIREKAFEQEWNSNYLNRDFEWDWRDTRKETVRRAIGCLIGEPPAPTDDPESAPPGLWPMTPSGGLMATPPPGPRMAPAPS